MSKKSCPTYKMTRDEWDDCWEMRVYKTCLKMQNGIFELYKQFKTPIPHDLKYTKGLVWPVARINDETKMDEGLFAIMFLNEENLGAGVVAHECLHVAFYHEQYIMRFGMKYKEMEDQERISYYFSNCVRGCYNILYNYGHIKKECPKER